MTQPKQYRKKPIVVTASQWWRNGDHPDDHEFGKHVCGLERCSEGAVVRYFRHPDVPGWHECERCGYVFHLHGWIDTLEGEHTVCPGDYIITGVQGERYPCKPDVFAATYEAVPNE